MIKNGIESRKYCKGAYMHSEDLKVSFYAAEEINDSALRFAVIVARYESSWVFCKHKCRTTWEVPGGHREQGETILDAAKRELFEETGAIAFDLAPVCVYSVKREDESFGMLFYAQISAFEPLPDSEMERIGFFADMPDELTYPLIQPLLFERVTCTLEDGYDLLS